MNTPRDTATDAREQAVSALGRQFAAARRTRDGLYQRGGARAVAEAAWVPGGPDVAELAEGFERLAEQARERRRAA